MLRPMALTMPKEVDASKNRLSHVPWVGDHVRSCYLAHGVSCIKPEFIHTNRGGGELTWYKNDDASNAVKALWNRSRFWTWSFPYQLWICIYIYIYIYIYTIFPIFMDLSSTGHQVNSSTTAAQQPREDHRNKDLLRWTMVLEGSTTYVSMYVCMYVYMYIYIYICVYIYR